MVSLNLERVRRFCCWWRAVLGFTQPPMSGKNDQYRESERERIRHLGVHIFNLFLLFCWHFVGIRAIPHLGSLSNWGSIYVPRGWKTWGSLDMTGYGFSWLCWSYTICICAYNVLSQWHGALVLFQIVLFQFGLGANAHYVILELYAQGNILLTDSDFMVLTLLRSHRYFTYVLLCIVSLLRGLYEI